MSKEYKITDTYLTRLTDLNTAQAQLFDTMLYAICSSSIDIITDIQYQRNILEDVRSVGQQLSLIKKLARRRLKELEG